MFLVTIEAPSHGQWFDLLGNFHPTYVAMTVFTVDFRSDVSFVAEPHVVRKIVDADPWDGLFVFPVR